ncbi:MAG: hypothetical protein KJ667_06655 [Alphaproteobacteria bacterium]|nr:hypothetical protein [Alphaproteobacteria bacterium]
MKSINQIQDRNGERGNVLFLILIAVALFAALSYAVTQSTRSGAGDTASETNLISSAQLTQYPAGIRTSVVRMIIGGIAVEELMFNDPSDFATIVNTDPLRERAVFHPQGGNATYQLAPSDVVTAAVGANPLGTWFYNAQVQIQNIGVTNAGNAVGNDVIAFLPNISSGICRRINEEVGLGNVIPVAANVLLADIDYSIVSTASPAADFPVADGPVLAGAGNEFVGQPFGCFVTPNAAGTNVYYHVLIER